MKTTFLILHLVILGVSAVLTYEAKCGPSEYLSAAGECCPMCNIGSMVSKDCFDDQSTSCKPCSKGTFMSEPNGLHNCFPCKICDTGLYILENCNIMKNTVCEVSDGYHCSDYSDTECSHAVKHNACKPGEQITTPGTKTSDTVCEPCPPGSYSPEGVTCSKWTDCSVNNEILDQAGTSTRDVVCKPRKMYGLIVTVALIFTFLLLSTIVLYLKIRQKIKSRARLNITARECLRPVEETNPQNSICTPSSYEGTTPIVSS